MTTATENEATVVEQDGTAVPSQDLSEMTAILDLTLQAPGFKAKVRSEDALPADEAVDPALIHISKDLIDPEALKEIGKATSEFKRWLGYRAISCSMLRGGMTLIPISLTKDVDERFAAFRATRRMLVDNFVGRYEELKEQAKQRLGKHYAEDDYPIADEIRASFGVKIKFLSFNVPAALKTLNRDLYEREKKRVSIEWEEAADEIREALRESFIGLVDRMADRLGAAEDGKPRTFRDSTVDSLRDFLSTFAARDLTNDAELAALAQQAKQVLAGVDPKTLRKQETTRTRVKAGMDEIKAKLGEMSTKAKGRRFGSAEDV